MYRLMIVEDEPIERQGIHLMLTNGFDTLSEICEAADGYEAIRLCRDFKPHIVMIDIHMPGINGLETIVELRKIDGAIRFVILTSHDKFQYAHEAIRLGVEDFILKPAGIARLRQSIGNVVDKLEHDKEESNQKTALLQRMDSIRPILERDCVYTLIADRKGMVTAEDFRFLDCAVNAGLCVIVKANGSAQGLLATVKQALARIGVQCIGEAVEDRLVFFLLFETVPESGYALQLADFVLQQIRQKPEYSEVHVGVSCMAQTQNALQAAYAQAGLALREAMAQGINLNVCNGSDEKSQQELEIEQAITELQYAVTTRDTFQQKVVALARQVSEEQGQREATAFLISLTERFALWLQANGQTPEGGGTAKLEPLQQAINREGLIRAFQEAMQELTQNLNREGAAYSNTQIGKILAYIELNYMKNLSLDSIAEQFSITPFYLSRLIKKKIGKSFPDLLADCRIRNAKLLLMQDKSIKEITYEVGFSSQNYFGKTFKKMTGVTPTDYKERHR